MSAWRDLSDDELSARLRARGVDPGEAAALVEGRDTEAGMAWIAHLLGGGE